MLFYGIKCLCVTHLPFVWERQSTGFSRLNFSPGILSKKGPVSLVGRSTDRDFDIVPDYPINKIPINPLHIRTLHGQYGFDLQLVNRVEKYPSGQPILTAAG